MRQERRLNASDLYISGWYWWWLVGRENQIHYSIRQTSYQQNTNLLARLSLPFQALQSIILPWNWQGCTTYDKKLKANRSLIQNQLINHNKMQQIIAIKVLINSIQDSYAQYKELFISNIATKKLHLLHTKTKYVIQELYTFPGA